MKSHPSPDDRLKDSGDRSRCSGAASNMLILSESDYGSEIRSSSERCDVHDSALTRGFPDLTSSVCKMLRSILERTSRLSIRCVRLIHSFCNGCRKVGIYSIETAEARWELSEFDNQQRNQALFTHVSNAQDDDCCRCRCRRGAALRRHRHRSPS